MSETTSDLKMFLSPLVRRLLGDVDGDASLIVGSGLGGRVRRDDVLASMNGAKGPVSVRTDEDHRLFLSPLVRRLLDELGADASTIIGSGLRGRIRRDDVLAATSSVGSGAAPGPATSAAPALYEGSTPLSPTRRLRADRVIESLASTAQLTSVVDVDVTRIDRLRCDRSDAFRARTGLGLDLFAFVAVAATRALRAFPVVNSRMEGNSVVYPDAEHVNIAVGAEAGVQSPLIRNAGDLDVEGFAGAIAAASTRAISGTLEQNEPHDGTFTLTDMGSTGVIFGTSVVMAPQVAILGAGALRREPVVVRVGDGDCLAMRSMLALSLSYDHRVVDGAEAARFLGALKGELETASFHIPR